MRLEGNLRKMKTRLDDSGMAQYELVLFDVLEPSAQVPLNEWVGKDICLHFAKQIHCVVTGKKIRKAYGEGMSWDAFSTSPLASPSIISPELSQAHLGIGLRDLEWEIEHHVKPHYTYLSLTSGIKVGVTRKIQVPTRWIDQGATEAIVLAETPYRQAAGLIEVALKPYMADKTNWRNMLKNVAEASRSLLETKQLVMEKIPEELQQFLVEDNSLTKISYPIQQYPKTVRSMKLDKVPEIEKKLVGIKGQYLIFEDQTVLNVRSHAGYRIVFEC
jgi:hypothetical protein